MNKRKKREVKYCCVYTNAYEFSFIESVQKVTNQSKSEIIRDCIKFCINNDVLIKK